MSSKKCIYRNCMSIGSGEITLFAFPKDEARRNLWLQLAGRSGHTIQKSDCLCELHFGRRFISSNQRRKVLVGLSVPFAFDQNENEDDEQIEALDECERLDMNGMFADDSQQPEDMHSCSSNSAIEQVEHVEHEDYEPETIVCDQAALKPEKFKRKVIEHSPLNVQNGAINHPTKLIKIDLNKTRPKNGIETTKGPHVKGTAKQTPSATTIMDHPEVSILYIRGEEFIQMPRSVYLEEKSKLEDVHTEPLVQEIEELREELNQYKNAYQIIKNAMRTLPQI